MRRAGTVGLLVILLVGLCLWLNVPRSLPLFFEGFRLQRAPVTFDFAFAGPGAPRGAVPVELLYVPKTPIFGITQHWINVIAPMSVDVVRRTPQVTVRDGHLRFSAPRGLTGLSNYRLQTLSVGDQTAPYSLTAVVPEHPALAPRGARIPAIEVRGSAYRFAGPVALWRAQTEPDADNPYVYSPRVLNLPAVVLWNGLRSLEARIELAPYVLTTFVVPTGWSGDGWANQAWRLTRPGATLTDKTLTLQRGRAVSLPLARECTRDPQLAVVPAAGVPGWSKLDGLWRPLPRSAWDAFRAAARAPGFESAFAAEAHGRPSLDLVESVAVRAATPGSYRIFAACPNPAYESVAVTWIDVLVPGGQRKRQS